MRIAIDARELAGQPTGVGRYLSEIVREWGSMPVSLEHEYVFCTPARMNYEGPLRATVAIEGGSGTMWEQRTLSRLARAARADVLFCPGYSGPVWVGTSGPPTVVAVHDVSFAAHPEWFRWREGLRRRLVTRASARRAARVLTLTEFSKREIVDYLGVPSDRIEVIYPGVRADGTGRSLDPDLTASTEPRVLYVGSIFNRRHVPETIRGFERLVRRRPDVHLTIVGDNRTFPHIDIDRYVRETGAIQIARYVSDDVLAGLYREARAFVFLSEYEGFGLTPLEALAAGIPIVVLDTPVAREVYGAAAFYVSAPDPRRIEQALELALFDEDARSTVLREAPAVVSRYSWGECARRVLSALLRTADRRSRTVDRE
jgi:glycosyltransferase involved in cell wall biosynthesis